MKVLLAYFERKLITNLLECLRVALKFSLKIPIVAKFVPANFLVVALSDHCMGNAHVPKDYSKHLYETEVVFGLPDILFVKIRHILI